MLSRNSGDTGWTIAALYGLGFVSRENDPGAAHAHFEEALHLARELGEGGLIGQGLNSLAMLALDRGDMAQARVLFEETLAFARTLPDPWNVALGLIHLTDVALRCDVVREAHRNLKEGLRIVREHRLRGLAAPTLRLSSELAVALGDTAQGARWSAGAAVLDHSMGSKRHPERERAHAAIMARARDTLGAQEFARATDEGAALGYEEALAEAQAWLEEPQRWVHLTNCSK
jgi:tetratricopeptide (TPR) repeat protein